MKNKYRKRLTNSILKPILKVGKDTYMVFRRLRMPSRAIAYSRVSTEGQDAQKFRTEILEYANSHKLGTVEFIEEEVSGTKDWRERKLGEAIETAEPGTQLIAPELSRLARSNLQLHEIAEACFQIGITVHLIKEGLKLETGKRNATSQVMLGMFATMAQFERDLISMRTKEALKEKKRQGVKLGRPEGPGKSKLDSHREEILALLEVGVPMTKVAEKHGTTGANLKKYLDRRELV